MVITKMSLHRRTFLRGLGTTIALPLLDAMVPALSAFSRTAATPARRLGFVYIPNGANMATWTPTGVGPGFALSPTLRPLAPFQDRISVLSGIGNSPADAGGDGGGDHSRGPAAWLNATHPKKTEGADIRAGTTIDQIVAREFAKVTQLASLELATEATDSVGNCGAGYSCAYQDTLSWRSPTTPLQMEIDPRVVFERLFGDGSDPAERRGQMRAQRSILDAVTEELTTLNKKLGPGDRVRTDEYLEAVREIERRIQKTEGQNAVLDVKLPNRPDGVPESFEEHCKLMFDLQVLAYEADITRVITFMMCRELSQRTYVNLGVPDPHHALSHHQRNPENLTKLAKINTYHVQLFAYYLNKLQSTPDGDGSLLDHVMILYGGGISDGDMHNHSPLPLLLAGGGAGNVKGRGHLEYPKDTPLANLLVTIADKMGTPIESIGNSTGHLSDI